MDWKSFCWEITVRSIREGEQWFDIGFVYSSVVDRVKLSAYEYDWTFISFYHYFATRKYGKETRFDSKWNPRNCISEGTRIRLEFNVQDSKCTVYCNDEVMGDISGAQPDKMHLAVGMPRRMTLATTKFEGTP